MSTEDTCCTIVPYFRVPDGRLNAFKELCQQFVGKANGEPKCLYYGFSFCGKRLIAGKAMPTPKVRWRIWKTSDNCSTWRSRW